MTTRPTESELRSRIQEYNFFEKHCKNCPADKHCCTRPQNVVLVRAGEEADRLSKRYRDLHPNSPDDALLEPADDIGNLFKIRIGPNGHCPFYTDDLKCAVHDVKPLDCVLWPLMFAETGEATMLDKDCPAVREGEEIPPYVFDLAVEIANFATPEERRGLAGANAGSYGGRLIDSKALGANNTQILLRQLDQAVERSKAAFKKKVAELRTLTDRIGADVQHRVTAADAVRAHRWLTAFVLALLIEGIVTTAIPALQVSTLVASDRALTIVLIVVFFVEAIRFLIPLPFIFTEMVRNRRGSMHPPMPRLITDIAITVVTFMALYIATQAITSPFLFISALWLVNVADLFWYRDVTPPDKQTSRLVAEGEDLLKHLPKIPEEVADQAWLTTKGTVSRRDADPVLRQLDTFAISSDMERRVAEEREAFEQVKKSLTEARYQEGLQATNEAIKTGKEREQYQTFAIAGVILTTVALIGTIRVIAPDYRLLFSESGLSLVRHMLEGDSVAAWCAIVAAVLYAVLGVYDIRRNWATYLQTIRTMIELDLDDDKGTPTNSIPASGE